MSEPQEASSWRTNITQLSSLMGWMLGALLLGLAMIPSDSWIGWFLHPLNSTDGQSSEELTTGVRLLRLMLPIAGLCWIGWTLLLHRNRGSATTDSRRETNRSLLLPSAIILFAGVAIRLPLLNDGLWYDEIASFWYYGQFGPGPIIGNMFTPANHTLQTLGSWTSVMASGGSLEPEIIRLPAIIMGLATIWPMSVLAREAFPDRTGMLLSIMLLLLCPVAILESTEARGYAFMLFFGTSGSALLTRYLTNGTLALLSFYAIVMALGIWSHLVTVVVPMGHALFLVGMLMASRRDKTAGHRSWLGLGAIGLAALTTITFLAPVIPDLLSDSASFSARSADQPDLLGREGTNSLLGLGGSWNTLGGLVGLLLLGFGCAASLGNKALRRPLLLTGAPILIAIVLVSGLGTWVYARFLVFGITFTILGISAGILLLRSRSGVVGGLALGALLLGWGGDLLGRYQVPRQPIREIMSAIPEDDSGIGFIGITDLGIVLSWYADDPDRIIDLSEERPLQSSRMSARGIDWLVIAYPSRTIPETSLLEISAEGAPERRKVVEGFVVHTVRPGWIDDDGSILLLKREEKDT